MVQVCCRRICGPPVLWFFVGLMGCPGNGGKVLPFRCHLYRRYHPNIPVSFCLEPMTWSILTFTASRFRMGQHPLKTGVFLFVPSKSGSGNKGTSTEVALLNIPAGIWFFAKGSRRTA